MSQPTALPALVSAAGTHTSIRFMELFAASIAAARP